MNRRRFMQDCALTAAGLWVPNVLGQRARRLGGGSRWSAAAAAFNGSSWLYRGAFVGASAIKSLTLSLWFKRGAIGVVHDLLALGPATNSIRQFVTLDSLNRIWCKFQSAAYVSGFAMTTTATVTDSNWHHLYISFDVNGASAGNCVVALDGVNRTGSVAINDVDIVWNENFVGIGARHSGVNPLTGALAEVVLYPGSGFRDPAASIGAFYAGGKPVDLGPTGSKPWGQVPIYYGHGQLLADTSGNNQTFTVGGAPTIDFSMAAKS